MKAKLLTSIIVLLFVSVNIGIPCPNPPIANLEVFREYVILGRFVILDGNDPCNPSYDPEGEITKYEWDFNDNGSYDYSETSSLYPDGAFDGRTTHIYDTIGIRYPKLRVTDNDNETDDVNDRAVHVCLDEDIDGLPGDWEELYDFNDANFADADLDSDGDEFNNLCEYLHGSEPNDNSSTPSRNITMYVPGDVDSIQRAINAAIAGDTIVVSEGTYYEVIDFNGVSCSLTSTDPNDWDVIANTIIDADNSDANVVTFENSEDVNSVLKGFTITGGARGIYCNGTSPTISNCVIADNNCTGYGGGIYCTNSASPTITNCTFSNNSAQHGGGICNNSSSPNITNCIFSDNTAVWHGGGIYNRINSSPTVANCIFSENQVVGDVTYCGYGGGISNIQSSPAIINCTFSGNSALWVGGEGSGYGGGMFDYDNSDPNVTNCIFWGNDANGSGDEIYNWDDISDPNFSYCDIEGGLNGTGCGGYPSIGSHNIDSAPCFLDANDPTGLDDLFGTFDDGLRLQIISPCIDVGDPNTDSNDVGTVDLTGYDRFMDGDGDGNDVVDMGAYELQLIWFVDADANGSDDGSSWEDAFTDLQGALGDASDGDEIWVAEGPYEPNAGSDRSKSFELVEGVGVYGGFAGTEVGRYQRDWTLYETILSGDINEPNDPNDNSYHVVKGADNAALDGFTITGGNANGSGETTAGGGMYNNCCSPTVANCVFSKNNAFYYGGGMYNFESSPKLVNCIFSENTVSAARGGGLSNQPTSTPPDPPGPDYPASSSTPSNPTLINCTFSGNSAFYGGGMNKGFNTTMVNCIFWGNDAVADGNELYDTSDVMISYCDIKGCGGSGDWDLNFGSNGGGNIDSDPCFLDVNNPAGLDGLFGTYDDGLRLKGGSPCIDAADGDAAPSEDILGLERVDINDANNGTGDPNYVDIGAYESYSGYGSDTDGDGLWDYEEYLLGTDPDDWDSDNDGLSDGNEFNVHHTNPLLIDTDGDGLSDKDELTVHYTNPLLSDTDSDGMDDGWEVFYDLDPLDDSDWDEDPDGDGKTNLQEYNAGTHPLVYTAISVIVYEYDNAGDVTKETIKDVNDANVAVTEYQYDELGRRWQQRRWANTSSSDDANDMITLYSYDVRSNLKETVRKVDPNAVAVEPNDLVTENFYDSLGRLTDVNDNGLVTTYTYYEGGEPNQVTDPNGNTTTNYYDNAGRLEKVTDAEDHYRLYYYDSLGRTIKQIAYDCNSTPTDANDDFELMQTRFEYNGLGRVTRRAVMADADSASAISTSNDMVVDYVYDANDANYPGLLTSETKYYASGTAATTYYEYDDLGRRNKITDHADNQTLLTYDEMGRITSRQQIDDDPLGSNDLTITTCYIYNSLGGVYKQVAMPDVNDSNTWQTTTYDYDTLGNRTKETRPNGVVTTYSYNALGRLVEKIADEGIGQINQTTEYGYDRLGWQTSITGYADGSTAQTTNYTYDKLDRITNVEYPDGNDIDFEYNPAGGVAKRIDQRGIVTTYDYDGTYNMLTKSVDGNSVTYNANETFTYDGLGRMLTATKDVNSTTVSETEFAYNDIGKITDANEKLFSGTKREIDYAYDQAGHPNSIDYPDGSTVNITPDWQGRIDTVKLGASTIATYKYIGSRVAQRSYPTPSINYQPSYDNLGRITSADSDANYATFDYEYAANTNNISRQKYDHRTNPADPCTLFSYDNLDRLTVAEYSIQSEDEVFTMDDLGNRTNVNVRNGYDVTYIVDANTNRYTTILGNANAGHWKMDDNAANTTVVDSSANGNDGTAQQNTSVLHTTGKIDGALSFNGDTDYIMVGDKDCLELQEFTLSFWAKHLDPEGSLAGGIAKGYIFGSATHFSYRMDFHAGLLRAGITNTSDTYFGTYTSLDDSNWHLWTMTVGDGTVSLYKDGVFCDDTGYTGTIDYTKSNNNFVIGARDNGSYAFEGDIDDVMVFDKALTAEEVSMLYNSPDDLSYDEAGSLTTDKDGYEYEYDYENRIVKITKDSNDIAEFAYDALGRRIRKIDSAASETALYYYNHNWQVLTEYDDANNLQRKFIYGNYIDEVLLMKADGNDYYYAHDHLYSPAALIDSSGTVLERYEYDAYGNCSILEPNFAPDPDGKSDYENPYLFTGRRFDILDNSSLKIQYNRNRYYDYYTGRWLTQDPLAMVPNSKALNYFKPDNQYMESLSLYEYVSSNPVIDSDSWGLESTYEVDVPAPAFRPFDHEWNAATAWNPVLRRWLRNAKNRAWATAAGGGLLYGQHDASRHLRHYLWNSGRAIVTDYRRMLRDSEKSREWFVKELKIAMQAAESLYNEDNCPTKIVSGLENMLKDDEPEVRDDKNWKNAIQGYKTWGRGYVTKGKKGKSCCYTMNWSLHLRSIYEFHGKTGEGSPGIVGLVSDYEMWMLNHYGWARHFRIVGVNRITLTWAKGYRLDHDTDTLSIIKGRLKPFPQCQ